MPAHPTTDEVTVRQWLSPVPYRPCWQAMRDFTRARTDSTGDELWLLEHLPVYSLGLRSGSEDAPADAAEIEVVQSDRGGLVTYHGPGQVVLYTLIDVRRRRLGLKSLVAALEQAVIDLLAARGIDGNRVANAPGVYVGGEKLASLGLRMVNGRTYHGLSLNVDMDLTPFERIHPCGFENLSMTDLARLGWNDEPGGIGRLLAGEIGRLLGYTRMRKGEPRWTSPK